MVLLDLLRRQPGLELIVAHLDHGIRTDSNLDREVVQRVAMSHNLRFESKVLALGSNTNEETARKARYDFLQEVCKKYNTSVIITAHHQDDLLETAVINLLRGTGRLGLTSLASTADINRPLLGISKAEIVAYAMKHNIKWQEDSTNQDQTYLRNYVRHSVLSKLNPNNRKSLLSIIVRQSLLNAEINFRLSNLFAENQLPVEPTTPLPRYQLIMAPAEVAYELLQYIIKKNTGQTVEAHLAYKLLHFVKTAKPGKNFMLNNAWQIKTHGTSEVIVEARAT